MPSRAQQYTRVLFVDQGIAFGGSLICIAHLIARLDRARFEPMVVAEMPDRMLRHHLPGVPIRKLHHAVTYRDWQLVNAWARNLRPLPLRRGLLRLLALLRMVANLLYAVRLALLVRRERIDLIHVNNGLENEEAHLAALLTGTRCVAHEHFVSELNGLRSWYAGRVSRFVAISGYIQGEMARRGIPTDRIELIPNPVPSAGASLERSDRLRARWGIDRRARLFGMVGRLVRWKGHPEFIAAAIVVLRRLPDARAVIVGDTSDGRPEYRRELERMIEAAGLADRFIFTGYLRDTNAVYDTLHLLVHASVQPEPFGLVITEAMARGIPVVASSLGAAREIIDDGIDGMVVDPNDTGRLADAITALLTDEANRRRMGVAARRKALARYDPGRYAERMARVYERALLPA